MCQAAVVTRGNRFAPLCVTCIAAAEKPDSGGVAIATPLLDGCPSRQAQCGGVWKHERTHGLQRRNCVGAWDHRSRGLGTDYAAGITPFCRAWLGEGHGLAGLFGWPAICGRDAAPAGDWVVYLTERFSFLEKSLNSQCARGFLARKEGGAMVTTRRILLMSSILLAAWVQAGCTQFSVDEAPQVAVDAPRQVLPTLLTSELSSRIASGRDTASMIARYRLHNSSGDDVCVRLVRTNCPCVDVELDHAVWEQDEMRVLANTADAMVVAASPLPTGGGMGNIKLEMRVSGSSVPETTMLVSAVQQVIPDLECTPGALRYVFSSRDEGTRDQLIDVVAVSRDESFPDEAVLSVTGLPDGLRVTALSRVDETPDLGEGLVAAKWNVALAIDRARFNPTCADTKSGTIVMCVGVGKSGRASLKRDIAISAQYEYGIECPNVIAFGAVPVGNSSQRRIQLAAREGAPFSITSAHTDNQAFALSAPTRQERESHWLELSFSPSSPGRSVSALKVTTSSEDQSTITISLVGVGVD